MEKVNQDQIKHAFDYNPDTGVVTWKNPTGPRVKKGDIVKCNRVTYGAVMVLGVSIRIHRLIWIYVNGEINKDEIDHINGIRDDNRIVNLRVVTKRDNLKNKCIYRNNKTGISGVRNDDKSGKYRSFINTKDVKYMGLGSYDNIFDAACARKSAEIKYGYHKNHGRNPT